MKAFIIYHLPAIVYAILIIVLSSIPQTGMPRWEILKYDKAIHFLEYAIFAFLTYRSFAYLLRSFRLRFAIYSAIFVVSLFALIDELYQSRVPGRQSDVYDAMVDILGAAFVIGLLAVRQKRLSKV